MRYIFLIILIKISIPTDLSSQNANLDKKIRQDIHALIDNYAKARETQDTLLLKSILTGNIDQLVSSGEWRLGIKGSMQGMMRSSTNNPGTRTLTIDKIRMLNGKSAITDARYEISNPNGAVRKMWSTFIVVRKKGRWKITAIRNMLPAGQQ